MNINGNHCAVYRPINPGLKYSVFDAVFYRLGVALAPLLILSIMRPTGLILFLSRPLTHFFSAALAPPAGINRRRRSITGHVTDRLSCVFNSGWLIQSMRINGGSFRSNFKFEGVWIFEKFKAEKFFEILWYFLGERMKLNMIFSWEIKNLFFWKFSRTPRRMLRALGFLKIWVCYWTRVVKKELERKWKGGDVSNYYIYVQLYVL